MASGKALYSIAVVALGFICFVVGAIAVGLPTWGNFHSLDNPNFDQGYFGPWRVCKKLLYNREKCGTDVSKFQPSSKLPISIYLWIYAHNAV
uniref:Uncharacterized protein n=1 Tax=Heliothis virescens TaxID=7102 RepID=A0A2A4J4Y2_HELVI